MSDLRAQMLALAELWERQAKTYPSQAEREGDLIMPASVVASTTVTMCAAELRKVLDGLPVEMLEHEHAEA